MHQPVEWQPWSDAAFAKAAAEGKPILLDIGAVWCHWCHVMDRESYENAETAAVINEHFVAIKVDRDERPDVDTRYQAAVAAISGQGGWPLTAFLTPEGLPYLVMEYVEGVPIDDHTDNLRLNVSERLKLFLPVCAAVQHAHQNLVIHRDLKPGNILVTREGVPKLLDFGIAKLLAREAQAPGSAHSIAVLRLLTPEFASPEQVTGEAVTTATMTASDSTAAIAGRRKIASNRKLSRLQASSARAPCK